MARHTQNVLSIQPSSDVDERDTRVPSSDPRGIGTRVDFRVAGFIEKEARVVYDEHRFAACRALDDVYRLCFAVGLEHVMSMQIRHGYLRQLRLAQRLLEEEDADQFFAYHLAVMRGVVDGLCAKGDRARARRQILKQIQVMLDTQGTPYELDRAGEIVEKLRQEFAQLLAEGAAGQGEGEGEGEPTVHDLGGFDD